MLVGLYLKILKQAASLADGVIRNLFVRHREDIPSMCQGIDIGIHPFLQLAFDEGVEFCKRKEILRYYFKFLERNLVITVLNTFLYVLFSLEIFS